MNRNLASCLVVLFVVLGIATAQTGAKPLQIYSIDVEGGQATLIVSPSGQSLLVDTGWPGFNGRDADRIVAAAKTAGLSQLDYVLITHYHRDHVGGVPQLAEKIKIGTFLDHGPNREDSDVTREAVDGGPEHNVDGKFIANPDENNDPGDYIKAEAFPSREFDILNTRNGLRWHYNVTVSVE